MFDLKAGETGELALYYGSQPVAKSKYPARLKRIHRMLNDSRMVDLLSNGDAKISVKTPIKLDEHEIALQNGSYLIAEGDNIIVEDQNGKQVFKASLSNLDLNRLFSVLGKHPSYETPTKLKEVRVQNEHGKYEILSVYRTQDGKLIGFDKSFLADLEDDTVPHPYVAGVEMILGENKCD